LVLFNPKGLTGESPGQRPGFGIDLESQALKGRSGATQGARREDVGVGRMWGHYALSGLGVLTALLSQGVALGYLIMPRWGGRPVPLASLATDDACGNP